MVYHLQYIWLLPGPFPFMSRPSLPALCRVSRTRPRYFSACRQRKTDGDGEKDDRQSVREKGPQSKAFGISSGENNGRKDSGQGSIAVSKPLAEPRWPVLPFRPAKAASGNRCVNRSIFLTGGTSGIGYAVAKQAVMEGAAHVFIVTRSMKRGHETVERIKSDTGLSDAPLSVVAADLQQLSSGNVQYDYSKLSMHRHNTFIHCAGVAQASLLQTIANEKIREIIEVNLYSAMAWQKRMLKEYSVVANQLKQEAGRPPPDEADLALVTGASWCVVNVASLLAVKGGYGAAAYAASKAGLIAFTRTLALEAAALSRKHKDAMPPFRANVVVPGYIDTPMLSGIKGRARQDLKDEIPLGRFGTPEEVADAIMFLLSNEYANNSVLNLDGGLSAV